MNIPTTRFGTMDVSHQELIVLPQGLIGFPALTRFAVIEPEERSVFRWWQAVDVPDTAFVVLDPMLVIPDYDPCGLETEWSELGVDDPAFRHLFVLVTVSGLNLESLTLNLAAPIVVNAETRRGRQLVLSEGRYAAAVRLEEVFALKGAVDLAA